MDLNPRPLMGDSYHSNSLKYSCIQLFNMYTGDPIDRGFISKSEEKLET